MRRIILVLIAALLLPHAAAFGVSPSSVDLAGPGPHEYELRISNLHDEEIIIDLRADGDVAPFIELAENAIDLSMDEDMVTVQVRIDASQALPGTYGGGVILEQRAQGTDDGVIRALPSVRQRVTVDIPADGMFIAPRVGVSAGSVGDEMQITVAVRNVGTEDVEQARARIEIHDPSGDLLGTRTTQSVSLAAGSAKNLQASWTPGAAGTYRITATIEYDGQVESVETTAEVGELDVRIDQPTFGNFTLGEIARISIPVTSQWNNRLPGVHAEVRMLREGRIVDTITTASQDISPLGRAELVAYWDTAAIDAGEYELEVDTRFGGRNRLRTDRVTVGVDGASVAGTDWDWMPVLVIIILATAGWMIFRRFSGPGA